jgi:hypothetical protein
MPLPALLPGGLPVCIGKPQLTQPDAPVLTHQNHGTVWCQQCQLAWLDCQLYQLSQRWLFPPGFRQLCQYAIAEYFGVTGCAVQGNLYFQGAIMDNSQGAYFVWVGILAG